MTSSVVVGMARGGMRGPRRRLDYVMPGAVVAGVIAAALGIVRLMLMGNSGALWVGAVVLFGAPLVLVLIYGRLRTVNAKVWVTNERIGVSNAIGMREEMPIADAQFIRLSSVVTAPSATPLRSLFVVDKHGRVRLRFYGADALQPGGIDEVSAASGLQLRGSWEDAMPIGQLRSELPGSVSANLAFFGYLAQHQNLVFWGGSAVLFVLFVVGGLVYLVVTHP